MTDQLNVGRTSWSVKDYTDELRRISPRCTGLNNGLEEKLLKSFPPLQNETFMSSGVVTDKNGLILMWYLPRILTPKRQVRDLQNYHNNH